MAVETIAEFEIAHVLMMDVVGYSKFLIDDQREINGDLTAIVRATRRFQAAEGAGKLIRLPTGDGMTLIFFTRPDDPVRCAMEIARALRDHVQIRLRMGIHSGPVSSVSDVNDRSNLAGAGINVTQRVMDAGDAGHILLSHRVAEDLMQYREWQPLLHDLGECEVKHGARVHLYNLADGEIGNPSCPIKCKPTGPPRGRAWARRIPRWQRGLLAGICLSCIAVIAGSYFVPNIPLLSRVWRGETSFEDLLQRVGRKTATRADFVFLGIDDSTLNVQSWSPEQRDQLTKKERAFQLMAERFPWSREIWALLLDRLVKAGAKLVVFDLVFNIPKDGDEAFRAALERYRDNVVIGWSPDLETEGTVRKIGPNLSLIPPPQFQDDRVGYLFVLPDPIDQRVRLMRYKTTNLQMARQGSPGFGKPYESLAARALAKLGHGDDVPRDLHPYQIRFSARDAYQPHPLWEVFDPDCWHSKYGEGGFFEDKLVIVGPSSRSTEGFVLTPIDSEMPGAIMQLQAVAAALDHEFLWHTPVWLVFSAIIFAGILASVLVVSIRRPLACLSVIVAIAAAYMAAVLLTYNVWASSCP